MNCDERNKLFLTGPVGREDLWPKITEYKSQKFQFRWEFGLDELPESPGLITIRGARQIGKSTWLEMHLLETIEKFGLGAAFFINCDEVYTEEGLEEKLLELEQLFAKGAKVRRIFIDEITQITNWERAIKRLVDSGHLRDVLLVTTGSNAADLRHGGERLPGRKGKLSRTDYIFLPISYREFCFQVGQQVGENESDRLWAYILSGGSPLAVQSIYHHNKLDENFVSLVADWILGDLAKSGRSRILLLNLLRRLYETAPSTISYTKLAKDAGLANNTAALEYVEKLADLLCVSPMMQWDHNKKTVLARKPSKFPFINLSMAWVFHPDAPRYTHELRQLTERKKGAIYEWVVAFELWRRKQLELQKGKKITIDSLFEVDLKYWASKENEIDFILPDGTMYEVKAGKVSPEEFLWFPKVFPGQFLQIICEGPVFETDGFGTVTLERFLARGQL